LSIANLHSLKPRPEPAKRASFSFSRPSHPSRR
jgi:hypothetical protein